MTVPDDLTIDIRGGKVYLSSKGRTVEIEYTHRGGGVFVNGPVKWRDIQYRYLLPALAQLTAGGA